MRGAATARPGIDGKEIALGVTDIDCRRTTGHFRDSVTGCIIGVSDRARADDHRVDLPINGPVDGAYKID